VHPDGALLVRPGGFIGCQLALTDEAESQRLIPISRHSSYPPVLERNGHGPAARDSISLRALAGDRTGEAIGWPRARADSSTTCGG